MFDCHSASSPVMLWWLRAPVGVTVRCGTPLHIQASHDIPKFYRDDSLNQTKPHVTNLRYRKRMVERSSMCVGATAQRLNKSYCSTQLPVLPPFGGLDKPCCSQGFVITASPVNLMSMQGCRIDEDGLTSLALSYSCDGYHVPHSLLFPIHLVEI